MMFRLSFLLIISLACQRPISDAPASKPFIANGAFVAPTESFASAMVALVSQQSEPANPESPYCSGVLIASRVVATAAHCLGDPYVEVAVGMGVRSDAQLVRGEAIKHPHYGSDYSEPFSFDLGLVILTGALPYTPEPLSIAKESDYGAGTPALVVGYGSMAKHVSDPHMEANQGRPLQAKMRIRDVFRKGDVHIRDDVDRWGLISAATDDQSSGGCEGDSGGPLIVWSNGSPLVAGIVNGSPNGRRCDNEFLFTNLDFYSQWISEVSGS